MDQHCELGKSNPHSQTTAVCCVLVHVMLLVHYRKSVLFHSPSWSSTGTLDIGRELLQQPYRYTCGVCVRACVYV